MISKPAIPSVLIIPDETAFDYQAIYGIAVAYAQSGLLISSHCKQTNQFALTFPAIVCSGFAIELFMKFFLMLDRVEKAEELQKNDTGHVLSKLWSKVKPNHKHLIAGLYRNSGGTPSLNVTARRIELFEEALENIGETPFLRWRYGYELTESTLMSHEAVVEVLDALGFAAEYIMKQKNSL